MKEMALWRGHLYWTWWIHGMQVHGADHFDQPSVISLIFY